MGETFILSVTQKIDQNCRQKFIFQRKVQLNRFADETDNWSKKGLPFLNGRIVTCKCDKSLLKSEFRLGLCVWVVEVEGRGDLRCGELRLRTATPKDSELRPSEAACRPNAEAVGAD